MSLPRQPQGIPTGGQFAATQYSEPGVTLAAEAPEPGLTLSELEMAEDLTGTYDADCAEGYYPAMEKVFAAARQHLASTPEGRQETALREEAERLEAITGTPAREIRSFHNDVSSATSDAERLKKVQLWCDEIFNKPYGEVSFLETQMRKASQVDKPSRAELVLMRRRLNDEVGALDVREAAGRIQKRFPGAASISAWNTGSGVGSESPEVHAFIADSSGNKLWQGDVADGLPSGASGVFDAVDLVPNKYNQPRSPLRTCRIEHPTSPMMSYDLNKMANLTADDLA